MNSAIVNSYFRSIQRGRRALEQIPAELREAVKALLDEAESTQDNEP